MIDYNNTRYYNPNYVIHTLGGIVSIFTGFIILYKYLACIPVKAISSAGNL